MNRDISAPHATPESRLCSKSSPTNPARAEEYISLLQIHGWHRFAPARNDGSLAYLANGGHAFTTLTAALGKRTFPDAAKLRVVRWQN